ncbi:MAG TPA: hypothetical protein VGG89_11100 [Candidatus Baltobacteraceae bacterium]|jgi:hypothetical protein
MSIAWIALFLLTMPALVFSSRLFPAMATVLTPMRIAIGSVVYLWIVMGVWVSLRLPGIWHNAQALVLFTIAGIVIGVFAGYRVLRIMQ